MSHDHKLLRERVSRLSGSGGVERFDEALSQARIQFHNGTATFDSSLSESSATESDSNIGNHSISPQNKILKNKNKTLSVQSHSSTTDHGNNISATKYSPKNNISSVPEPSSSSVANKDDLPESSSRKKKKQIKKIQVPFFLYITLF